MASLTSSNFVSRLLSTVGASLIALVLMTPAGCQARRGLVRLPPPSFDGPQIAAPVAVQPVQAVAPSAHVPTASAHRAAASMPPGWVPDAQIRPWRWIVIHHSATPTGGAAAFDRMHRAKGWDEIGYHWVIGNGSDTGVGQIEPTSRWGKQKWGAHTKTPDNRFNDYGIGICLVGNFDNTRPSSAQVRSLARLVAYLMQTYKIPADHVLGHRDCKPTDCPGRNMNIVAVRQMATQMMAQGGEGALAEELGESLQALMVSQHREGH